MASQKDGFLSELITDLPKATIAIFFTSWNQAINKALLEGAISEFENYNQVEYTLHEVPGCVELSFAIQQHYHKHRCDAYIAFGCVIKGGTPHFDYVCDSVTHGITHLNCTLGSPIIFGVLTLDNEEQAWERLGGTHGHKGKEAAQTALRMIQFKNNM